MRSRSILPMLLLTASVFTCSLNHAEAGFPAPPGLPGPSVNVHIDGYLPAPPGVNVQIDAGRPYYVQHDRRVYIERERYDKRGHYKKNKKHHEDRGNKYGHYKGEHGERGEQGGHGGGGHGR
jgi:hypothetical protein